MENQNNDLALINKHSRKPLTENQVYIFNVTLCDNEIDRDFEQFTKQALEDLCPMFEGKTGIFDHNMKSSGQSARIFKTWVETDSTRKTSLGEPYSCLKAKAYMVRTNKNQALIDEIEGGIKKEVSIGCAMDKITCSVCGKEMKSHECSHIKGKTYGSKLCFGILSEPTDAYEWSFVAVPAQREAGVTKSFTMPSAINDENPINIIKVASGDIVLTKAQANSLRNYITSLEKSVESVDGYKQEIISSIKKYALIAIPEMDTELCFAQCKSMDISQLMNMKKAFKAHAEQILSAGVQLSPQNKNNNNDNKAFKI
ncbi:MAG: hypothetical protein NC110_01725 [Ruminococcus sp.]|nr:hypothetical protein [Ruminococcus sp.]